MCGGTRGLSQCCSRYPSGQQRESTARVSQNCFRFYDARRLCDGEWCEVARDSEQRQKRREPQL